MLKLFIPDALTPELDPVVYNAAKKYFDFDLPSEDSTINLIDGAAYISELARMNRETEGELQKWDYVVHDCFTGGAVPSEVFTREFWGELCELVEDDGIVAVVSHAWVSRGSQLIRAEHGEPRR